MTLRLMKRLAYLFSLLVLALGLSACRHKDDLPLELESTTLAQTVWEGVVYSVEQGDQDKTPVILNFYDDKGVQVTVEGRSYKEVCVYKLDKRLLVINNGWGPWPVVNEFWYIRQRTRDHLVFEIPPGDRHGIYRLEIHRRL